MSDSFDGPALPPPIPDDSGWNDDDASRTGPAWEQGGPWFPRFAQTAQAALLSPSLFFSTMRRTGGIGAPILYGVLGTVVGGVAAGLYQFLLGTLLAGVNSPEAAREQAVLNAVSTGCIVIVLPVITVLSLFINAGITHVMLLLLNGARRGFETTMRVAAYAHGSTALLNLVPLCGGVIGGIWTLVIVIIGIARAHEIPTGKAAAAVLIPIAACCVLVLVFYAAIAALVFGAVMAGTSHQ